MLGVLLPEETKDNNLLEDIPEGECSDDSERHRDVHPLIAQYRSRNKSARFARVAAAYYLDPKRVIRVRVDARDEPVERSAVIIARVQPQRTCTWRAGAAPHSLHHGTL